MATLIRSAVEYVDFDTSSADDSTTLSAVTGKSYEIRNSGSGGNILTVTYGSDSIIFNDGESGRFTYDGTGWATQFSAVGGAVSLYSGIKAFDVRKTTGITSSGWKTIAQLSGDISGESGSCDISVTAYGTGRLNTFSCEVGFSNSDQATREQSIVLKKPAKFFTGSEAVEGFRISNDPNTNGKILQVYLDVDTTQIIDVLLSNNISSSGGKGIELVSATSSLTLPGGGTASTFIEAGSIYLLEGNAHSVMCSGVVASSDVLVLTIRWPETPKPTSVGASVTFTDPVSGWLLTGSGTGVSLSSFTAVVSHIYQKDVTVTITKTGAFGSLGDFIGMRTNGTGGNITL